ncbi:uncharacterized protein FIBRA_06656 [Fibroporia radiculosa]|uniref:Uncharacterized protein n=1 Tax=Fibroporia radiculosa TaxID=599839 RepID=J4IBD6_9APHY|nr:uncharacterized protein FIBRA_06656 [Fibroporia radiculosa]CCM04476.1 predicted protein [Fibroporia radiculosa]
MAVVDAMQLALSFSVPYVYALWLKGHMALQDELGGSKPQMATIGKDI